MGTLGNILAVAAIVLAVIVPPGALFCADTGDAESGKKSQSDGGIMGTIPPDSPFAKISIGMSMKHVYDLIGPPTDTKSYTTGKSFIPFYFGSDRVRIEALYKGMGRITFTGRSQTVYRIVYDPSEKGYADTK